MTRFPCPYCSQIVDAGAVACSTCGGLLTIGSHLAIRQALAADPTLSLKDPESVARLKEFVTQIDESISASERSKLEAEIQKERAEKEALRLQQEQVQAKQLEQEAKRKEYLDSLPSLKRFMVVRKIPIVISLLMIAIAAVAIPNQISKAREESQKQQVLADTQKAKEIEQAKVVASAGEDISEIETEYCALLGSALEDPQFQRFITTNMSEAEMDQVKEKYTIPLAQLYNEYTSIGVDLGSDRGKILSPILEESPIGNWWQWGGGGDEKYLSIIALCNSYAESNIQIEEFDTSSGSPSPTSKPKSNSDSATSKPKSNSDSATSEPKPNSDPYAEAAELARKYIAEPSGGFFRSSLISRVAWDMEYCNFCEPDYVVKAVDSMSIDWCAEAVEYLTPLMWMYTDQQMYPRDYLIDRLTVYEASAKWTTNQAACAADRLRSQ